MIFEPTERHSIARCNLLRTEEHENDERDKIHVFSSGSSRQINTLHKSFVFLHSVLASFLLWLQEEMTHDAAALLTSTRS